MRRRRWWWSRGKMETGRVRRGQRSVLGLTLSIQIAMKQPLALHPHAAQAERSSFDGSGMVVLGV
jgi:hypothetical protein